MAAAYESGEVPLFSHEAPHEMANLITRANPGASPHCIRFGYNGRKLAVASDELEVKVIDTRDTTKVQLLPGHDKAVTGLGWNPEGSVLVTSSCDGALRVFDLASEASEPTCLRVLKDIIQPGEPQYVVLHLQPFNSSKTLVSLDQLVQLKHIGIPVADSLWSQANSMVGIIPIKRSYHMTDLFLRYHHAFG